MPTTPLTRRAVIALLLAAALGAPGCTTGVASAESPALGEIVQLGLTGLDGAPVAIPTGGARATVLHFWSPECPSCRATIPALLGKRRELEAQRADIVLVCVLDPADSAEDARAVLSIWGIYEPFVVDRRGAAMALLGARSVPAVAIIDAARVLWWLAPDGITTSDVVKALPPP